MYHLWSLRLPWIPGSLQFSVQWKKQDVQLGQSILFAFRPTIGHENFWWWNDKFPSDQTDQRGPPGFWGGPLFPENFHETLAKRSICSYFSTAFSENFGIVELNSIWLGSPPFEEIPSPDQVLISPFFCDSSDYETCGCLKNTHIKDI